MTILKILGIIVYLLIVLVLYILLLRIIIPVSKHKISDSFILFGISALWPMSLVIYRLIKSLVTHPNKK